MKAIAIIGRGVDAIISRGLIPLASVAAATMVLAVFINIVSRFLFNRPLIGTIELVQVMDVVAICVAIAYTAVFRGHVHVEVLVSRLHRHTQAILASIMYFISAAFFLIIAWQGAATIWSPLLSPRMIRTDVLHIPLAPFMFILVLGFFMLGLRMLLFCFQPLPPKAGEKEEAK